MSRVSADALSNAGSGIAAATGSGSMAGASIVGHDHGHPTTADLTSDGAQRFANVVLASNTVRG